MTPAAAAADAPTFLLDRAAYTDAGWFGREQSRLFARTWSLLGDARTVREPGEYLTAVVGGVPLIVVVGEDGVRRAFHNMCRHRGMVMLAGAGTCRAIRCDYHAWRYGLDGALRVVPQRADQFPDLDADALGLLPAAVAEWEGLLFACPDPAVAPLGVWMDGFADAVGSVRPGLLPQVAAADIPAASSTGRSARTGSATSPAARPTALPGSTAATHPSLTSTSATATGSAPTCCSPT